MIELTALRWFSITGRGQFASIDPDRLGDRTLQIGDHVLLDGAERVITAIEFVDSGAARVAHIALRVRDPQEHHERDQIR